MARWLLPLLAVFALLGRTVTAFAAAGWVGKLTCCCPNPETCKCHHACKTPHDVLDHCGADAKLVAPEDVGVTEPAPAPSPIRHVRAIHVAFELSTLVSAIPLPPEPPPI